MKIHKSQLENLISQYLFEEDQPDDASSNKSADKEKNIRKELETFKGFHYETEDYKHSIVSKDGGLRLTTIRKGDGFEEKPLDLSLDAMVAAADGDMEADQKTDHGAFTEKAASIIAGYIKDNKNSKNIEYFRKFFAATIGDVFSAATASRVPLAHYNRDYVVGTGKNMLS